MSQAMINIMS